MACTCLHCTLGAVIRQRHPGGFTADDATEIATALATLSGEVLSGAREETVASFIALLREHRELVRQQNGISAGGLH